MTQGYLAFILHAHLPYVRDPKRAHTLEQNWLFEALTETYIPLCLVIDSLIRDGIDFRLTFSLTPPLAAMIADPLLQSRYVARLDYLIGLAEREAARTNGDTQFHPLALMYHARFTSTRDAFVNLYKMDLLAAFRRFQQHGVEVIASAATHAYLPVVSLNATAVRAQIGLGVEYHRRAFAAQPDGFWLPECGYFQGLDAFLARYNIRYTILETHGITRASERPRYGVYAPLYCPSGVAVFGRDPESSRQVWSAKEGYPGDFDYREFYRDIGQQSGDRTGIKYYRVTGTEDKEPYVPEWAERKAEAHAAHFIKERIAQMERLAGSMDRKPLIVAPYDAELFGHWWYEGPRWLDYVIRKAAVEQHSIRLVTLSEYLDEYPTNQTASPAMSSWGFDGFSQVWLNERTDWIYPPLHGAADAMERLATHPADSSCTARARNQAATELLLAQASDWAFMINSGTMVSYARMRIENHLMRFHQLRESIDNGTIDESWLAGIEDEDRIFADNDPASYFSPHTPTEPRPASDPAAHSAETGLRRMRVAAEREAFHVVMICPEILGFAKTGGLADMVGSLASALDQLGMRVSLIMPAYREVFRRRDVLQDSGVRIAASVGGRIEHAEVMTAPLSGRAVVYLIRADRYFDRDHLYGGPEGDYPDNAERFAFFCRAALELVRRIDPPDFLHVHDWQTALAVVFLKAQPERYPGFANLRTLITVHNLGYQGLFAPEAWRFLELDWSLFSTHWLEFYGKINFLKGGVLFADAITTVSATYAEEIRTKEYGFGLEGVFRQRATDLVGILNGVDYSVWNPTSDHFLAQPYSPEDPSGKRVCKSEVQEIFGVDPSPEVPLLGVVSRLAAQKGVDLIQEVLPALLGRNVKLVLLGSGDRQYQEFFRLAAEQTPERFGVKIGFDEALAHKIEAGADMLLMPSHYEPSGLNQLYSMRYGTIPIVRATGGLKDSVKEFDPATGIGSGFAFEAYTGAAFLDAVDRALALFERKEDWVKLMRNAMTEDFSWNRSAREYVRLYGKLVGAS